MSHMVEDVFDCSKRSGMSVLIAGAGVGGLMTALECWRRGFQVRIVERCKSEVIAGAYQCPSTTLCPAN